MAQIFSEISIILILATIISSVTRFLKLPIVLGYILTGVIIGPALFDLVEYNEILSFFSQIGVALLLFIVGLNLSPKVIKEVGKVAFVIGSAQVLITFLLGIILSMYLGYDLTTSIAIGIGLSFSSTIIVLKLLSDRKELDSLHGKVATGILLIQDLIAMLILVFAPSLAKTDLLMDVLLIKTVIVGTVSVGVLIAISIWILPKIGPFFAKSQENLFLFSLAYGIGLASVFSYLGFSIEIGALLAGVTLTFLPFSREIASRLRPLRDFFVILFFIYLGTNVSFDNIEKVVYPAIIFAAFVLLVKPFVVTIVMNLCCFRQRVSFITGLTIAQISEFSLILITILSTNGMVSRELISMMTLVGLITIAISSYIFSYSNAIYYKVSKLLSFFKTPVRVNHNLEGEVIDAFIFGYNRIGYDILKAYKKLKLKSMVIDYDPEVIKRLKTEKVEYAYGDASDIEFLMELNLGLAKMIVSTIPDFDTNLSLIATIRKLNRKCVIIVMSHQIVEAKALYKAGASYVILPHFLGGSYVQMMINKYRANITRYKREKEKHLVYLKRREKLGHYHPAIER